MSALVAAVSLAGLVAVVLAGLNERRRELAILRAVGAGPRQVMALLAVEGGLITLVGVALGVIVCGAGVVMLRSWVQSRFGITLSLRLPSAGEGMLLLTILASGWLASLLPGWRAYRLSLADGLSPRV